jgi:hypothetical protein
MKTKFADSKYVHTIISATKSLQKWTFTPLSRSLASTWSQHSMRHFFAYFTIKISGFHVICCLAIVNL